MGALYRRSTWTIVSKKQRREQEASFLPKKWVVRESVEQYITAPTFQSPGIVLGYGDGRSMLTVQLDTLAKPEAKVL